MREATGVLDVRDVTRSYGARNERVRALSGVSITVGPGELVAVMGPSGSGKSTLLRVAGGLEVPDAGDVVIRGCPLGALNRDARAAIRRRAIGFVFQDLNLVPSLTAIENVALPLELDGMRRQAAFDEALRALTEVQLDASASRYPGDMSGGEQQRVAIARAFVGHRTLILADEPTGALDSRSGEATIRALRAQIDAGAAGLLVTHDARLAGWADRTVFLRDGVVVDSTGSSGQPESLLGSAGWE